MEMKMKMTDIASVLVIDDELGPRESLRILLKNDYSILSASSVDEGIDLLRENRPQLVIMDIRMPEKNGIDGLKEIRSLDAEVPIIMLTGYSDLETARQAIRHGANDYMKKPFDSMEMVDIIQRNLERSDVGVRREEAFRDLQALNEQLMEQLSQKDQLAKMGQASAEMIHDIKNPLTTILGYVELLTEHLGDIRERLGPNYGTTNEYLACIERGVSRCQELAQIWQNQSRNKECEYEILPFDNLVRETVLFVEPLVNAQALSMNLQVDLLESVNIRGRRSQLLRAFHNIITNAIHALEGKQNGKLTVNVESKDEHIVLNIIDNGAGISADHMSRLFEEYFTTKDPGRGTGLGLPISRKIIEEHDGALMVSSMPGYGTTVTISLPIFDS